MFPNIGTSELIIIGIILVIFFGSQKLKELARGLGESSKEIKKIKKDMETAFTEEGGENKNV